MKIKTKLTLNTLLVFLLLFITSILVVFLQQKIMLVTKNTLYENSYKKAHSFLKTFFHCRSLYLYYLAI